MAKAFNLEDAAGEDVDLALLLHSEQASLLGSVRDGVHQVTQGDPGLHAPGEAHEDRLRHVERHDTGGSRERDEARTGRKRNPDRETRVRIAPGAHGIGKQHPVEPRMDNSVTRAERYATAVHDEIGERVVCGHVDRLRVSCSVTERLHHEVSRETQTRQIFQLVASHWSCGVLRTDCRHARLAILAGENARPAASLAYHLLRHTVPALGGRHLATHGTEDIAWWQLQRLTSARRESTANDERDTSASPHFIEEHVCLDREIAQLLTRAMRTRNPFVREDLNDVAHLELGHIHLERERTRIFHGVEEDGCDLASDADPAATLIGHVWNIIAHVPEHGISC
mmetsp:Transcript_7216/g.16158  ORF Transcript_7216/g.16158 Transcript_7216/m.16158 type:complete len:340 (-) Transcript_7216:782-1801(-)